MVQKILDGSSRFEQEQIGLVKFEKFIQVFAHEKKRGGGGGGIKV